MKFKVFAAVLCVALMAVAIPASAYLIQAEDILGASDWQQKVYGTRVDASVSSQGGLLIVDDDNTMGPDMHDSSATKPDYGDLWLQNDSDEEFGGEATVVVRMKTTSDYAFTTNLAATATGERWDRSVVVSLLRGDPAKAKRCVSLSVRPDSAAVTNNGGSALATGSSIMTAQDNTKWATWVIVAKDYGWSWDLYRKGNIWVDGVSVESDWTLVNSVVGTSNLTSDSIFDTPYGGPKVTNADGIDALSIGASISGTVSDATGSWMFDYVAYQGGSYDPLGFAGSLNVPEPGSMLALCSAFIGLAGFVTRRRK